jgi:ABC-type transporter Mla maintaining outer membrane lipid asymmetry ATPase subunit MlaF
VRRTQQNFALTVVMLSHDVPQVFEVSDQIAYMNAGKIELAGSVSEVMSSDDQNFKRFLAGKTLDEDELLSTGSRRRKIGLCRRNPTFGTSSPARIFGALFA